MTRDEFLSLPPAIALAALWDHGGVKAVLGTIEAPKVPPAPRFDDRIFRKGGYQWASETDLEGLKLWHNNAVEGERRGGKYADKDARRAKSLSYWIEWRKAYPTAQWVGDRYDDKGVTAAPPSRFPTLHEREQRAAEPPKQKGERLFPDEDDGSF